MNIKKKKIVFSSIIGLTVLSLCSIGFSSWIIGINQPKVELNNIPVKVDTISEKTCYLNIVKSSSENGIILAENTENKVGDGIGFDSGTEQISSDLTINLEQYDFAFALSSTFTSLTFDVTCNGNHLQGEVPDSDLFERDPGLKNYITLKSYSVDDPLESDFIIDKSTVSGYQIYTARNKVLTFVWGDFFKGQSPATFYGDKIDDISDTKQKLKAMDQAKKELEKMEKFFQNDLGSFYEIKITAKLEVNFETN